MHPCPNFNGSLTKLALTLYILTWLSNYIPLFYVDVLACPCPNHRVCVCRRVLGSLEVNTLNYHNALEFDKRVGKCVDIVKYRGNLTIPNMIPAAPKSYPDSSVGWPNVGPTSVLPSQRWANVSPTFIAVWVLCKTCISKYRLKNNDHFT